MTHPSPRTSFRGCTCCKASLRRHWVFKALKIENEILKVAAPACSSLQGSRSQRCSWGAWSYWYSGSWRIDPSSGRHTTQPKRYPSDHYRDNDDSSKAVCGPVRQITLRHCFFLSNGIDCAVDIRRPYFERNRPVKQSQLLPNRQLFKA